MANRRMLNEDTDPPTITKWSISSWYFAGDGHPVLPLYIHGQPWLKNKYSIDGTNPANKGKFWCTFGPYRGFYDLYKEGDVIHVGWKLLSAFDGESYNNYETYYKLVKAPKLVLLNDMEIIPSTGFAIFNSTQFFSTYKDHFTSWNLTDYSYPLNPYASYITNMNAKDTSFRPERYKKALTNLKFGFDDGFSAAPGYTDYGSWLNIGDVIYAYDYWVDSVGTGTPNYGPYIDIPSNRPVKVYFKKYQLQWAGSQAETDYNYFKKLIGQ
jgi:hypothetical protein